MYANIVVAPALTTKVVTVGIQAAKAIGVLKVVDKAVESVKGAAANLAAKASEALGAEKKAATTAEGIGVGTKAADEVIGTERAAAKGSAMLEETENAAKAGAAPKVGEYPNDVIQYERYKTALQQEEFTSIVKVTDHGLQRLIERGFTPAEVIETISKPTLIKLQSDGLKVFIKQTGNKYMVITINEESKKIVTAIKNIDEKALYNLGVNHGWR